MRHFVSVDAVQAYMVILHMFETFAFVAENKEVIYLPNIQCNHHEVEYPHGEGHKCRHSHCGG